MTYIPRLLPFVLRREGDPPDWMKRTLQLLPYTAIGALLIPDAFTAVNGGAVAAGSGLIVAILVMWVIRQPFLAVIGAVAVVAAVQTIL